jgi:hypothetical protein
MNASHHSARYAERKRAAERARDAAAGPSPCNRCAVPQVSGSIFCAMHRKEYEALLASGTSPGACAEFCRRTHWPVQR